MRLLYDFVPVLLFFIVFQKYGIYVATVVGIVATVLQVFIHFLVKKSVEGQQMLTLVVFVVFGGLTLYFHNPLFVKWKPTVIFWIMAVVFLVSQFVGTRPLVQRMMETSLQNASLRPAVWYRLNVIWAVFFALLGGINLLVAFNFSTAAWVGFKLYGVSGLLLLFCLFQAVFLARHLSDR